MWTHKCKIYGPADGPLFGGNIVETKDDRPCYWCGLTEETSKQLSNEHINENKQFLQEINEHGQ